MGFDEVNGRLEEADQNLLAQTVLNEDGEISREEVLAELAGMQRNEQEYLRLRLKARISEFERTGQFDEAMRLTVELNGARTRRARSAHMTNSPHNVRCAVVYNDLDYHPLGVRGFGGVRR